MLVHFGNFFLNLKMYFTQPNLTLFLFVHSEYGGFCESRSKSGKSKKNILSGATNQVFLLVDVSTFWEFFSKPKVAISLNLT